MCECVYVCVRESNGVSDLHVGNRFQLLLFFWFFLLKIFHQVFNVGPNFPKIQVPVLITHTHTHVDWTRPRSAHIVQFSLILIKPVIKQHKLVVVTMVTVPFVRTHVSVELIVLCREDHLPQLLTDAGDPGQVDAVVVQTQELVDHGLVRPLQENTTCAR